MNFISSASVDVAAGLVLMYLLLSLSCTFINEIIATSLSLRAKVLEEAIADIIDVPFLREDFYNHGLIDASKMVNHRQHVSYLHGRSFALGLLAALDRDKSMPTFETLLDAAKKLPDSNIRDVIFLNMVAADGSIMTLCDNIARWFDHAMDRVSGLYNRKLKAISLIVGILLATAINADTIAVSRTLWHDSTLRAELLVSAENAPHEPQMTFTELVQMENSLRPLPLGWQWPVTAHYTLFSLFTKLAGLLMTGLALSLGAPFWFDLLSRFINLRGTGSKPDANTLKSTLAN